MVDGRDVEWRTSENVVGLAKRADTILPTLWNCHHRDETNPDPHANPNPNPYANADANANPDADPDANLRWVANLWCTACWAPPSRR